MTSCGHARKQWVPDFERCRDSVARGACTGINLRVRYTVGDWPCESCHEEQAEEDSEEREDEGKDEKREDEVRDASNLQDLIGSILWKAPLKKT
jgi:3'-phosphoadenosine 5'-phosphosulfate sulfotransferase (PAPS reductase)/FAD synthetase